jgi:crotonobetainyl-CoA:carnitine CoA-transferase CaiB-like acyl-CoA transferase
MLNGIRVIDFSNYLPGPFASMRLAELGAEIIKVEPPSGDPARHTGIQKNGEGIIFRANNRYKKSITMNLKNREDVGLTLELISTADVVLESFRPGVMKKLGLGYNDVQAIKPDIVYCSISGYGQAGPHSQFGSHDINYMALSGVLSQLKGQNGKPIHPSITFADFFGGFAANERILAGLVAKLKTGQGSFHSISLVDVMVSIMGNHVIAEKETGYAKGISILNGTIPSYALYETFDGRYVSLAALEPKFWENFCKAAGREDWIAFHYVKTEETNRVFQEITTLFKSKRLYEWIDFSQKVDCCLTPVLEVGELDGNPYFKEKELVFSSAWGDYLVKMHSDRILDSITPPPKKGEHNLNSLLLR